MMSHTPEPWFQTGVAVGGGEGELVHNGTSYAVPEGSLTLRRANARRIAAAVNACAGIPTEDLEADVVRRMREWMARVLSVGTYGDLEDEARAILKETDQ